MIPGAVDVAVLGPVAVTGTAAPFRRPAARELAVYLALHRRTVRHDEWSLALWPDRPVAQATVHSTASDCRRALGRGPDGALHLPRGPGLRLGDTVTTDVERFAALSGPGDPTGVLEAMRLVRGGVFGGLRRADWVVLDGTGARIEAMVVDAALSAADELIRCHGGAEASWVVRQALLVSPYDERLYRMLLRATEAQGNRAGLRGAVAELRTLAGEELHAETTALYLRLVGGLPAAGVSAARL